jgi:hypothetical protein
MRTNFGMPYVRLDEQKGHFGPRDSLMKLNRRNLLKHIHVRYCAVRASLYKTPRGRGCDLLIEIHRVPRYTWDRIIIQPT